MYDISHVACAIREEGEEWYKRELAIDQIVIAQAAVISGLTAIDL